MNNLIPQLILNGLIAGCLYALIGLGFSLKYKVTGFFDFSYGAVLAIGAYGCWGITNFFGMKPDSSISIEFIFAATVGILIAALSGLCVARFVFRPLSVRGASELSMLLASLGIYTVIQNILSLVAGDDAKIIRPGPISTGFPVSFPGGGLARITGVQISIICIAVLVVLFFSLLIKQTHWGKKLRAVANDQELARVYGLDVDRIKDIVHVIGGALAGIAGILLGLDTDLVPSMGFPILVMVMAAMVMGGIRSLFGVLLGGLLVGLVQNLGVIYVGTEWQDMIIFVVLILFLIFRPQGILWDKIRNNNV